MGYEQSDTKIALTPALSHPMGEGETLERFFRRS
jgi:hypothetical protein